MAAKKKLELFFDKENETTNTIRFKERTEDEADKGIMGKVYVQKDALAEMTPKNPTSLKITVEGA